MGFSSEEYQRSTNSSSSIGTKNSLDLHTKSNPSHLCSEVCGRQKSKVLNKLSVPMGFLGSSPRGTGLLEGSLSATLNSYHSALFKVILCFIETGYLVTRLAGDDLEPDPPYSAACVEMTGVSHQWLIYLVLGTEPRVLHMLGLHVTNLPHSSPQEN